VEIQEESGDRLGMGLNLSAGCTVTFPTAATQASALSHAKRIAQSSVVVLLSASAGTFPL